MANTARTDSPKSRYVNDLLARYEIAPTGATGTDSLKASRGGTIATLRIEPYEHFGPVLSMTIDGRRVSRVCPLQDMQARSLVDVFASHHLLPRDESFSHMIVHLLMKTSKLYFAAGVKELTFLRVHLHPSAYHIGGVRMTFYRTGPHRKARLAPHAHDRRTGFMHRAGLR